MDYEQPCKLQFAASGKGRHAMMIVLPDWLQNSSTVSSVKIASSLALAMSKSVTASIICA